MAAITSNNAQGEWTDNETGKTAGHIIEAKKFVNNSRNTVFAEVKPGETFNIRKTLKPLRKTKEPFVMVFQLGLQQLILDGQLNNDERAVLFTMAQFLTFDGRIEVRDAHGQLRPLIQKDLYALMGWSEKSKVTMTKVINSLENKGLILRVREGRATFIQISPGYFFVGKMNTREKRVQVFNERVTASLLDNA